jgi:transcriptional regulator of acetoin/glycerol metabolism
MTTKITYRASSNLTTAREPVRVKESVAEVLQALSQAKAQDMPFLQATDAETGKEISVKTNRIDDISEE